MFPTLQQVYRSLKDKRRRCVESSFGNHFHFQVLHQIKAIAATVQKETVNVSKTHVGYTHWFQVCHYVTYKVKRIHASTKKKR